MKLFFSVMLLLLLLAPGLPASEYRTLRLRVTDYAPFVYQLPDSGWVGVDLEVVAAIIARAGYRFEPVEAPWERALNWLKSGEIDLLFGLSRIPEREPYIDFIGVTRREQMTLVVRKGDENLPITSLDDLAKADGMFGVHSGAYYTGLSERMEHDPSFREKIKSLHDEPLLGVMTAQGRLLGHFDDLIPARYKLRTFPDYAGLALHTFALPSSDVYVGASRKLPDEVRERLKTAYEEISKDGTLKAILDKWGK